MATIVIPNIPGVEGKTVTEDDQLRQLLIAMKITLEKITGATVEELDALLAKNN